MKKIFLAVICMALLNIVSLNAQRMAVLSHNGAISVFTDVNALRDAYVQAEDGDIISLSGGIYNAVDVKKGITIRGAGMQGDTIHHTTQTILRGNFQIDVPDSIPTPFQLEGVYHVDTITVYNMNGGYFSKNRMGYINNANDTTSYMKSVTFIHCKIAKGLALRSKSSAILRNCYVANPYTFAQYQSLMDIRNCVIYTSNGSYLNRSNIVNSIYYGTSSFANSITGSLPSSTTASYTLGIGYRSPNSTTASPGYAFINIYDSSSDWEATTETILTGISSFSYSDTSVYKLSEADAVKYIGDDGTEIGMYGGTTPYSPIVECPQITNYTVAKKSSKDGTLSVDVTVEMAE